MNTVRVAIVDSGVHVEHPHVGGIEGGVRITADGETDDFADHLGHGTAVAAAIHEKAPDAQLYAIKVFHRTLSTDVPILLRAIQWCIEHEMDLVNMSLGTTNPAHKPRFEDIVSRTAAANLPIVAAREAYGRESLPGSLRGVINVGTDWDCPRQTYRCEFVDGQPVFLTSPFPRPIPGVSPRDNLHGVSFSVANMTGIMARASPQWLHRPFRILEECLVANDIT